MQDYQLGEWDLSKIAKSPKDPEFQKKIKDIQAISQKLSKK